MSTRFITRTTRIVGTTLCVVVILSLAVAGPASADEGHAHPDPVAAVPPVAAPAAAVEQPAPAEPAPAAQPAPTPDRAPAPVAAPAPSRPRVPAPANHSAHAGGAPARVATPANVSPAAGGGVSDTASSAAATPAGELPFTGPGDNILLIALAGMLMPMGVLLFCAARRGDLRHLAMPRFQWAPSAPHTILVPQEHVARYAPAEDPRAFQWAEH